MLVKILKYFVSCTIILSINGCGSSNEQSLSISKFDTAKPLDLAKLDKEDIQIITGSKNVASLRSIKSQKTTKNSDQIAIELVNEALKNIDFSLENRFSARSVSNQNRYKIIEENEPGNIDGNIYYYFKIDKESGYFDGVIKYQKYKNSSSNDCGEDEVDEIDGNINVNGTYDIDKDQVSYISMIAKSNLLIGDEIVLKKGFNLLLNYLENNRYRFTLNGEILQNNNNFGFKDYEFYVYNDDKYLYSYPKNGKIYIFNKEINGYFWVDSSYDHSLTPTKKDICTDNYYEGEERYQGYNSSLRFKIDKTNHYIIEIDEKNDNTIDKTFQGDI